MKQSTSRMLLGAAVAGILGASLAHADQPIPKEKLKKMAVVPCYGVNQCKGHGTCSGVTNKCGGQNGCKGQGWVPVPKDSCLAIGGSLTPTNQNKG